MRWLSLNSDLVLELTFLHLAVSLPPVLLSLVLAVPIGWLAHRFRRSGGALLAVTGLLYAIPSLPLFIILPAFTGAGLRSPVNIVIALTLYGIALMARTSADAFDAVATDVRESAAAIGFSPWSRFWRVDLPLAGPVLVAGLRVVIVSTVSLVTVGAVIGGRSLGTLFTDGFQRGIAAEILTGIVMTVAVALLLDLLCVVLGRALLPWAHAGRAVRGRRLPAEQAGRAA